jgi:hypothetical protein
MSKLKKDNEAVEWRWKSDPWSCVAAIIILRKLKYVADQYQYSGAKEVHRGGGKGSTHENSILLNGRF